MKTGECAGRTFVINECRYSAATDSWILTCARQQDDTLGLLFPYSEYAIKQGDRFVLVEIAMPELYIRTGMERLYDEGNKLLARASKIISHYEPSIDAKVMVESGRSIREGMFMEITDEDVIDNGTDYILIDSLSIYEDESAIPTYKVTLREKKKVTYKGTPSATSSTSTKSAVVEESEANVDLSNYATKEYVDEKTSSFGGMFYWADEEKTIIGTKYDFFSEKEISAGGIGEQTEGGNGIGIIDAEMSDTSENAVQNKTIKEYIDKTDAVLSERIAALELGGGGGSSGGGTMGEGDKYYYHSQGTAEEEWIIEHNLGKYPSVTVVSSAGEEIFCDKTFVSVNKVKLNFGTAVSGAAFLN